MLRWTRGYILLFTVWATIPVLLYKQFEFEWLHIPWQPISLIGIAVAFYLGFKNNSSYDRLWEARKIWGGIVNASRSFTVLTKHYVNNDEAGKEYSDEALGMIHKRIVHRHVAWLYALTYQLRKLQPWEHSSAFENSLREKLGTITTEDDFKSLKEYLNDADLKYVLSKGNRASHILSVQTAHLMQLRQQGLIEHFRHLEMQNMITEFYTLQGKAERIKNFPFPRQYASVNLFFVVLFLFLLPFGMMDAFMGGDQEHLIWLAIPFTVIASWVFWVMEMIGDYSENPFEGLYNDVPISSMARGIEIDIREMLDETDLPAKTEVYGTMDLIV